MPASEGAGLLGEAGLPGGLQAFVGRTPRPPHHGGEPPGVGRADDGALPHDGVWLDRCTWRMGSVGTRRAGCPPSP
eukprot:3265060-Pyramimonas_sp.AAC.1